MLPRATLERTSRERQGAGGRTQEIQRLIGRSLRAALKTLDFGERTIRIDCDVLQADGGTRTASITGATVALADACTWMARERGVANPFGRMVAAVSVGVLEGQSRLDLNYAEDRVASMDANVVIAEPDRYVEVQGTGERDTFDRAQLDDLLGLASSGIAELFAIQHRVLSAGR
jgi:ribonuclease PH